MYCCRVYDGNGEIYCTEIDTTLFSAILKHTYIYFIITNLYSKLATQTFWL